MPQFLLLLLYIYIFCNVCQLFDNLYIKNGSFKSMYGYQMWYVYVSVYQLICLFYFILFFSWGPWEDRTFVLYGYLQLPLYALTLVSIVYIIYITGILWINWTCSLLLTQCCINNQLRSDLVWVTNNLKFVLVLIIVIWSCSNVHSFKFVYQRFGSIDGPVEWQTLQVVLSFE